MLAQRAIWAWAYHWSVIFNPFYFFLYLCYIHQYQTAIPNSLSLSVMLNSVWLHSCYRWQEERFPEGITQTSRLGTMNCREKIENRNTCAKSKTTPKSPNYKMHNEFFISLDPSALKVMGLCVRVCAALNTVKEIRGLKLKILMLHIHNWLAGFCGPQQLPYSSPPHPTPPP